MLEILRPAHKEGRRGARSGQYVFYDVSVDVGQAACDTVVVKGQALMIDSQKMQDRSVKIMPRDPILHGFPAHLVGGAVGVAVTQPASSQPDGEAVLVVITTAAKHFRV